MDVELPPDNLPKRTLSSWPRTRMVIVLAGAVLAVMVLIPTTFLTHGYIVRPQQLEGPGDWLQILLPFVPPLVALLSVMILLKSGGRPAVGKGIAWALLYASTAYLLFQAYTLTMHYTLIAQDGTALWGMLQLPVMWVGLPLLVIAGGIGAFVGWLLRRKLTSYSVKAGSS